MISVGTLVLGSTSWTDSVWGAILVPAAAAAIAALVAVIGYLYDRGNKRRDDLRALFSDALAAVADYQELPYRIRRRSDISPMTSSEIVARAGDIQSRLDLFTARLQLESLELGEGFSSLVRTVRAEAGVHMTDAWKQPRIDADADIPLRASYSRDKSDAARVHCIVAMQAYLRSRSSTR